MSWLEVFLLGASGQELGLTMKVQSVTFDEKNVEQTQRNIAGDLKRTFLKVDVPVIAVSFLGASNDVHSRLKGMFQRKQILNLKAHTALGVRDQLERSTSTTKVTLTNTGASGISIVGVFLSSDFNKSGTNYFTSGSYNSTTREITLGSALPGANTDVIVDYNYTGHNVMVTRLNTMPHAGASKDLWMGTIELTGR